SSKSEKLNTNNNIGNNKLDEICPITSNMETSKCYAEFSIQQNDYSVCANLPLDIRGWGVTCYAELAVRKMDKEICNLINNISGWGHQSIIDQCFSMVDKGEVTSFMVRN
ncbi:MAG TPA: hypothetical protein VFQ59_02570, partial [Candidatus Paceibacterota bacterium]|nr:hypothetical protein [Candidatus Paceibacterota bacterium]